MTRDTVNLDTLRQRAMHPTAAGVFLRKETVAVLLDVAEAAQEWAAHYDAGKKPAGSLVALERYYQDRELAGQHLRDAVERLDRLAAPTREET